MSKTPFRTSDLPLGPKMPSLVWQIQILFNTLDTLKTCHDRYGDTFRLPYENFIALCVSSPTGLQSIFSASPEVLSSHQRGGVFDLVLGERSLVFLEGREHQRHRRILMPPFHGESLQQWSYEICRITQFVLDQPQYRSVLPVRAALKEIALRVILQILLGGLRSPDLRELYQLLTVFFQDADSPLSAAGLLFPALRVDLGSWSPWGRFVGQRQRINQIIEQQIQIQKASCLPQTALITLLLNARDDADQPLSSEEIRDELLMMIFAGYETTTSAIAWALYWIHQDAVVQEKLRQELDGIDDPLAIARLPYLNAVCQEVLRIYPVAIGCFARQVRQPFDLDGYLLPPGTIISPSIYLAHRRSETYPDAEAFRPERFLERSFSAYEYLPFGGGMRRCIGSEFAKLELKLIVATILKQMCLEAFDRTPIRPIRYGITMAPPTNLTLKVLKPMQARTKAAT